MTILQAAILKEGDRVITKSGHKGVVKQVTVHSNHAAVRVKIYGNEHYGAVIEYPHTDIRKAEP